MAELLPDRLGIWAGTTEKDEKPKLKKHQVTSILESVQCYRANPGHAGLLGPNCGGMHGIQR